MNGGFYTLESTTDLRYPAQRRKLVQAARGTGGREQADSWLPSKMPDSLQNFLSPIYSLSHQTMKGRVREAGGDR